MAFTDNLLEGKYKNIVFRVRTETVEAIGQKRIEHNYPNSSLRYAEAQGKSPFDATLTIFFHGENAQQEYRRFKRALENPAPGRLTMPSFGIINNVVAFPAGFEVDHTRIGEYSATVRFTETIERPSPTAVTTVQDVFEQGRIARQALQASFAGAYLVPEDRSGVLVAKSDFVNVAGLVSLIGGIAGAAANFVRTVATKLQDPAGLAALLLSQIEPVGFLWNLFETLDGITATSKYKQIAKIGCGLSNSLTDIRLGIFPNVLAFNIQRSNEICVDIPIWEDDNYYRTLRNRNRYAAVNVFRVAGLIGYFEQAAEKKYTTTEDIDMERSDIDLYYQELIENDITGIIIPDLKKELEKLKGITTEIINNQRQSAYSVTEIKIEKPLSAHNLAYQLYGELIYNEQQLNYMRDLVANLNRSQPRHKLHGTVKVVEIG